ncbi:MAG: rod shape-determining protein [Lentisphaeria bacterium]|nr:rod shape-determining protein [Lentisphaeria bacterium]
MINQKLAKFFSSDVGIDLGTANCLVFVKDKGIVLAEPSVVAVDKNTREVLAVGMDAYRTLGRCPTNMEAIRPMKDGVIADFEITGEMLRYFIAKARSFMSPRCRLIKPRVMIAVPSGITPVERRAVEDSVTRAGAREVIPIEEPMASAVGVGLPVAEPSGSMIVDIGGGTTEVAVISLAGIVEAKSCRVGGDEMNQAIVQHMKKTYSLLIGEPTAERIKMEIGSAYQIADEQYMDVKGGDMTSGLPKNIRISSSEIRKALQEPITNILEAIRATLERCPPELSGDLYDRGIMLAGGGALLRGLSNLIAEEVGIPVNVADDPLRAVANGTGIILQDMDALSVRRPLV